MFSKCNSHGVWIKPMLAAFTLGAFGCSAGKEAATPPTKAQVDDANQRWQLADLFPTDDAWRQALATLEAKLPELDACKGTLGQDAAQLAKCFELAYGLRKDLARLDSYARKRSDEDTRDASALEMKERSKRLGTTFDEHASFIDPELLRLGSERAEAFIKAEPKLVNYAVSIRETLRRAPHTLDDAGEKLLAQAGLITENAEATYNILTNAEIAWPKLRLNNGESVTLSPASYTRYRASPNRSDREAVFKAFFGKWTEYEQTFGVTLNSQLKEDVFYARARRYPNCLARALDADNVPESVYHTLIKLTNDNLGTLHRYLKLRARMLGLESLRYHDVYPPLVKSDLTFPLTKATPLVLAAVAPLGNDYVNQVKHGLANRWMDTYPRPGKRSGAYSSGSAYDVHPFVLMNYNDDYESVSTLVHEWGHTMHSLLANRSQPYPTADYSIFVAEVASTFNEALLLEHMQKTASNDNERLYYLGTALENLRGTFFRQAMFADFELQIHQLVESGEALSGQRMTELYRALLRRYHGHDQGVLVVDDLYGIEWAYVPHFYYNFYVYQYATSLAASAQLVKDVQAGTPGAADRYLKILRAGGSAYPYELLKEAGVDLATPAPYEALMAYMNSIMDQIEAILNKSK